MTLWVHRWIKTINIWRGEELVFASFEYVATPLWFWEDL